MLANRFYHVTGEVREPGRYDYHRAHQGAGSHQHRGRLDGLCEHEKNHGDPRQWRSRSR